jgi:hypothetical protein
MNLAEKDAGRNRRIWQTTCFGKKAFESRAVANMVGRRIKGRRPCSIYKCKGCGKYHIGTPFWGERPNV